ncbi:MAG TPA: MFS transporter, partial [Kofleriaceae bacterium]|nr:MFS transporter [Kofleriaceae bacterium]
MLSPAARWSVVVAATATMAVSYVDRTALGVLGDAIRTDLEISNTQFGWIGTAFAVAYLISTPLSGWWLDKLGARRGLVGSVLVWSMVAGLHALVPGFGTLFALRIALGLAEGPGFPGAAQTVQRVLPETERARGFGVLFTGSSIGGMLAGPLASLLFRAFGWRLALLETAIVGLAWIPMWIVVTRSPAVRELLDKKPEPAQHQASFYDLVRHPIMIRGLVAVFAVAPAVGFLGQWGGLYLAKSFKVSSGDAGGYTWLPPLFLDAGALLFGDLASRRRRAAGEPPRLLFAIAMLLAMAMALLPLATTPWQGMAVISVSLAGGGAIYTLTTSDMLSRIPIHQVSFAGGILAGAQSLAAIIMHPLIGASVDASGNYDSVG